MEQPKFLLIDAQIAQALVNYLATRPWREVHDVMQPLMNLPPAREVPPQAATPDKPDLSRLSDNQ